MTGGHCHRKVRVPSMEEWYVRLLRKPLRHTTNVARVDPSPYPYGLCEGGPGCPNDVGREPRPPQPDCYTLSLLGILHRWTGLTLETPTPRQCGDETCTEDHA